MGSLAEVILHKAAQRIPPRSASTKNMPDLKALEFDLRRQVISTTRLATRNLINDHYITMNLPVPTYREQTIPLKHMRRPSLRRNPVFANIKKPTKIRISSLSSKVLVKDRDTMSVSLKIPLTGNSDGNSGFSLSKTGLFPEGEGSPPLGRSGWVSERVQEDLKESCGAARRVVQKAKRRVRREKRVCLKGFKQCSKYVERALKVDVEGYIPKELALYKERRAAERKKAGAIRPHPPSINLQHEVIKEYRTALVSKALSRGIDKDMRFIYTFGSISTEYT